MATNAGHEYRVRIGPDGNGRTLSAYLASRYRHTPESGWIDRIVAGQVVLDGRPAPPDTILRAGSTVVWRRPPWREPDAPLSFAVLYRDADILGAAKPAGLPTLPGAGFLEHTLLARVRTVAPDASPLHRLGRFTSGPVLFSRNRDARAALSRDWSAGRVRKTYRATACGDPDRDEFDVETPIGPVPYGPLGTVHAASAAGKPARSRVTVVARHGDSFDCEVRIATGRPHQIRIHLAAAGHPLAGDPLYGPGGAPLPGTTALPGDPGYRLHAVALGFRHPRTGLELTLRCGAPPSATR